MNNDIDHPKQLSLRVDRKVCAFCGGIACAWVKSKVKDKITRERTQHRICDDCITRTAIAQQKMRLYRSSRNGLEVQFGNTCNDCGIELIFEDDMAKCSQCEAGWLTPKVQLIFTRAAHSMGLPNAEAYIDRLWEFEAEDEAEAKERGFPDVEAMREADETEEDAEAKERGFPDVFAMYEADNAERERSPYKTLDNFLNEGNEQE